MKKTNKLCEISLICIAVLLTSACQPYARTEQACDDGYVEPNPYKHWGHVSDEFNLEKKGKVEKPAK